MHRLSNTKFLIVNQGLLSGDAVMPFAFEELMMRHVAQAGEPVVHIWRHQLAFIAGLRDRRLPYAEQALRELRENQGYQTAVRNSGGAAVPLHPGVANVSVIFPKPSGTLKMNDDFAWMADFLAEVLTPLDISFERGEVVGSYCPGDFDLSINGRKFCGIAQRRRLHAYSLQAFVIVEGEGEKNGEVARWFYERATGGRQQAEALQVEPQKMASLQQITRSKNITVERFLAELLRKLQQWGGVDGGHWPAQLAAELHAEITKLRERYDR